MKDFRNVRGIDVWFLSFFLVLVFFLVYATGLHGDDFTEALSRSSTGAAGYFHPGGFSLFYLGSHYMFWWAYHILGYDYQVVYDFVKFAALSLSVFLVYAFARDYLSRDRAMLLSLVFVLAPWHETTMYWYMTVPYVFFPALLMYSHALVRRGRWILGFLLALVGAFSGYMAPPYVFGLSLIFLLERQWKKAALFLFLGILYVGYYFWIKFSMPGVERRIDSHLGLSGYVKQVVIQVLSFADAAIGPSYGFKAYYAIGSLGLLSGILALALSIWFIGKAPSFSSRPSVPKSLLGGIFAVLVLSFAMYALTGMYPQSCFNLGNRGMVYGSLLIALIVALLPMNRVMATVLSIAIIFPVFGLSQHWKDWNRHQKEVIAHIHQNEQLVGLEPESTLLVSGNIYSHLGPFSHIELFSMPWAVNAIFDGSASPKNIVALTPYMQYEENTIIDSKFGGRYELGCPVYLYDSNGDTLEPVPLDKVSQLVRNQPPVVRHWVQLAKGTWVESLIVSLSPRLAYLFGHG